MILAVIGALMIVVACGAWFQWTSATLGPAPSRVSTASTSTDSMRSAAHLDHDLIAQKVMLLPHEIPVVHRSVLEKLEGNSVRHGKGSPLNKWPPLVTRIPEATAKYHNRPQPHICDHSKPDSCRFLFPFRISDQEYKARRHIEQLAKLALELNRTLVLPNVGKSRAGPCYKYAFEVYYESRSLQESLGVSVITMDAFKNWAGPRISITAQVITLSAQPWQNVTLPVVTGEDIVVQVGNIRDANDYKFPGCFSKKFPYLDLDNSFPHLIMSPSPSKDKLVGNSIVYALSGKNDGLEGKLRSTAGPVLQYSLELRALAQKIAPPGPYLAIYWSMESLSSDMLELCAHTLVDAITSLLLDPALSSGIKNIFFSSDYPYPLSQTAPYSRWTTPYNAQVDGFNAITERHAEAMSILRKTFEDGGGLSQWSLIDFIGEISHMGRENVLQDRGIGRILERTISSRAALFVTANSRTCGGASPLATQIIDMRRRDQVGPNERVLRNLVDVFG